MWTPRNLKLLTCSTGPMVAVLKHEGITDRERERLKMSAKTPASWYAHALSTRPGMQSKPTAFWMFTRRKDHVTSATETENVLTASVSVMRALSVSTVL